MSWDTVIRFSCDIKKKTDQSQSCLRSNKTYELCNAYLDQDAVKGHANIHCARCKNKNAKFSKYMCHPREEYKYNKKPSWSLTIDFSASGKGEIEAKDSMFGQEYKTHICKAGTVYNSVKGICTVPICADGMVYSATTLGCVKNTDTELVVTVKNAPVKFVYLYLKLKYDINCNNFYLAISRQLKNARFLQPSGCIQHHVANSSLLHFTVSKTDASTLIKHFQADSYVWSITDTVYFSKTFYQFTDLYGIDFSRVLKNGSLCAKPSIQMYRNQGIDFIHNSTDENWMELNSEKNNL